MITFTPGVDYPATYVLSDVKLIGVATVNAFAYAFALLKLKTPDNTGATVQLSAATCNQGIWQTTWANLGAPSAGISFDGTFQGTVVAAGTNIWVYVCGGDGQLWCRGWAAPIGWLDWQACPSVAGGPAKLAKVDHAVAALVFVVDTAGQAWAMAPNPFGQWVAMQQDAATLLKLDRQTLPLGMGDGYYCALTLTAAGLDPKLFKNAGIASNNGVIVQYDGILPLTSSLMEGGWICVVGWNPSAPQTIRYSARVPFSKGQPAVILLAPTFEDGAFCWVLAQGGTVQKHTKTYPLEDLTEWIRQTESEANFNYRPTLPSSPQGGNITYAVSVKGTINNYYWSFSGASNCK